MIGTINEKRAERRARVENILGAALASALAPGCVIGLAICIERFRGVESIGEFIMLPLLAAMFGMVIGMPFSTLVFAPSILLLSKFRPLSWPETSAIGFASVFFVTTIFNLFVLESVVRSVDVVLFSGCGVIAGFVFWLMLGDIDLREGQ